MKLANFNTYFFFAILALVSVGSFLLFLPFLSAIFVAALFAAMFDKPQTFLLKYLKKRTGLASAIMCLFVALVIVLPIAGIANIVTSEVRHVITEVSTENSAMQQSIIAIAGSFLSSPIGGLVESQVGEIKIQEGIGGLIASAGNGVLNLAKNSFSSGAGDTAQTLVTKTYKGLVSIVLWVFVMFFTLFYFFIDGRSFIKKIMALSPLRDAHEEVLIAKFVSMARATLKGTFIIGAVQGSIGGLAFLIAGVSSPMLWMVIMIFLSVIPAVGAGLVIFPAGVIMLFLGNIWEGIFLLSIGAVVSSIDNIMRPKLVGNDTQMHSLLIFFGTIGGMSLFGLIGFIVGPIILALAIALWEIYAHEFRAQLKKYNR